MADNSYALEIKIGSAAGYFTPEAARQYYGRYSRDGVTYHWWNRPELIADSDHDNIVKMFLRNFTNGAAPTVNYVASAGKLTLLASPDLVTWTSGNGNATTIGVECSPHFTDALYRKLGWLHDQLEQRYNKTLAIYVHKEWMQTECSPIDKSRIRREADQWKAERNQPAPKPAPTPVPPTVTVTVEPIKDENGKPIVKKVRLLRDSNLWDLGFVKHADAKSVTPLTSGTIVEVSAIATHPTGSKYYLSNYSYQKGIKNGINVKDCEDYVDVVAPPPATKPADPTPVPVEVPLTIEERLSLIEKFLITLGFKK